MSFTTWVRAQDAFGQFDVRKGDDLREGVSLVKNYPEYVGISGRPGKPFVNIGTAATDGYKGLSKQELLDEITRRNEFALLPEDAIEIKSERPTVAQLTGLLKENDEASEAAAAAAAKASGLPAADEPDNTESSDAQPSDTGETTTTTTDAGTGAESE